MLYLIHDLSIDISNQISSSNNIFTKFVIRRVTEKLKPKAFFYWKSVRLGLLLTWVKVGNKLAQQG